MKHVIIGNGIAGVNAADTIRSLDPHADIVMIGDENFPPYSRPMICNVLEGSQNHINLPIRPKEYYREMAIEPAIGQRVDRLDIDAKRVRLSDGSWIGYDTVLIASGADPRPLKADGVHLDNIFYMRTESHVQQQVDALANARRALVLGGGLVGFKAAYGLLKRGLDVTMLITSAYPLSMQVDPPAGKWLLDELLAHGLQVQVDISVVGFNGNGSVRSAATDTGIEIPCDMVIIGKGVLPALSFVPKDRIEIDLGIVVDDHMQSSVPSVYAAGDAAESVDIARQTPWVNAIWPEAAAQGRIAGANMAGRPVTYPGSLSRNVMRVFDLDVMTMGYTDPEDTDEYRVFRSGSRSQNYYRSLVFRDDLLVGAVLINRIEQGGILRALIENRIPIGIPVQDLLSPSFNFSRLL